MSVMDRIEAARDRAAVLNAQRVVPVSGRPADARVWDDSMRGAIDDRGPVKYRAGSWARSGGRRVVARIG